MTYEERYFLLQLLLNHCEELDYMGLCPGDCGDCCITNVIKEIETWL